jgi:hypothetical protein
MLRQNRIGKFAGKEHEVVVRYGTGDDDFHKVMSGE